MVVPCPSRDTLAERPLYLYPYELEELGKNRKKNNHAEHESLDL